MLNRDKLVKNIITTILLILILIVEGCFNFITLEFNFSMLYEIQFWIKIIFKMTLLLLVRMLALTIFKPKARENNKELQVEKNKNEKLVKLKEADFPYWIENVKNVDIKKEAWKNKINKKLLKLERKASDDDRHLFYDNTIPEEEKIKNKYYRLKMRFLSLLTNDFIDSNINTLQVKFQRLDAAIFDLPVNLEHEDNKYQISSKTKSATVISLAVASIGLLITNVLISGFAFGVNDAILLATIISLSVDLVFLSYQFLMGIFDSYRIINTQELLPYVNRNRILKEYFYYKKPDDTAKIDKIFNALDNNTPN